MKFPFFAVTILIAIFCAMMMIKSFDYGQAWAIVLSIIMFLTFAILSIIALMYQLRQHERDNHTSHH